jgi:hypothetical protein
LTLFLISQREFASRLIYFPYSKDKILRSLSPVEFVKKYKGETDYYRFNQFRIYGNGSPFDRDDSIEISETKWNQENLTLTIMLNNNCAIQIVEPMKIEERIDRLAIWNLSQLVVYKDTSLLFEMECKENRINYTDRGSFFDSKIDIQKYYPAFELCSHM